MLEVIFLFQKKLSNFQSLRWTFLVQKIWHIGNLKKLQSMGWTPYVYGSRKGIQVNQISYWYIAWSTHCTCSSKLCCFGQRPWLAWAYLEASSCFARGLPPPEDVWRGISSTWKCVEDLPPPVGYVLPPVPYIAVSGNLVHLGGNPRCLHL